MKKNNENLKLIYLASAFETLVRFPNLPFTLDIETQVKVREWLKAEYARIDVKANEWVKNNS